jgi:hypothetical protein
MEAAADPLTKKKGGKKGTKAMLGAARYEGPEELPNRIVDLVSLEQQIRRFIQDLDGPRSMTTPPCDKMTRAKIHELANAFSLKSQSKGSGNARYTTLTKTTKAGMNINERKIKQILKTSAGYQWDTTGSARGGKFPNKVMSLAKHREGEEVGKVCWPHRIAVANTYPALHRLHLRSARPTSDSKCWLPWAGLRATGLVCPVAWKHHLLPR